MSEKRREKQGLASAFFLRMNRLNALQVIMVIGSMLLLAITFSYSIRDTLDINRSKNILKVAADLKISGGANCSDLAIIDVNDRDDFKKRNIRGITTLRFANPLQQFGVVSVLPDTYIDLKDDGLFNGKPLYDSFDEDKPHKFLSNIKSVTDFDTYAYITLDDEMIMEVTNMLGVIRLNVKKEDISDINKYQKKIAKKYGVSHVKKIREPGVQAMNGLQTAAYARLGRGEHPSTKHAKYIRIVIKRIFRNLRNGSLSDLAIVRRMLLDGPNNVENDYFVQLAARIKAYTAGRTMKWPMSYNRRTLNDLEGVVFPIKLVKDNKTLHEDWLGEYWYKKAGKDVRIEDRTSKAALDEILRIKKAKQEAARRAKEEKERKEKEEQENEQKNKNKNEVDRPRKRNDDLGGDGNEDEDDPEDGSNGNKNNGGGNNGNNGGSGGSNGGGHGGGNNGGGSGENPGDEIPEGDLG